MSNRRSAVSQMKLEEEELPGARQFDWAAKMMPALKLSVDYVRAKEKTRQNFFAGKHLAACLHISKESAVLLDSLSGLGMEISLVAANPLSSQNEIASYLRSKGIKVSGTRGESYQTYKDEINRAASSSPDLIIDDGGELHVAYSKGEFESCFGGTDETTSGTHRLRSLEAHGLLRYNAIPVNEARVKHLFDNKYGTGQSSLDGLLRATGLLIAGKVIVVAGYGWVGKGVAMRSKGLGARVIVTETDPIKALEAHLDGYEVLPMKSALRYGEIYLTCTGQIDVITSKEITRMRDGAILANCGHFDSEIDVIGLKKMAGNKHKISDNAEEYFLHDGKSVILLCEGRVVNLVAAEGHPPEIMQLSFATQLLSLYYLTLHRSELRNGRGRVMSVPSEIEHLVSRFALTAFKLKIDKLNSKQLRYISSFNR